MPKILKGKRTPKRASRRKAKIPKPKAEEPKLEARVKPTDDWEVVKTEGTRMYIKKK